MDGGKRAGVIQTDSGNHTTTKNALMKYPKAILDIAHALMEVNGCKKDVIRLNTEHATTPAQSVVSLLRVTFKYVALSALI
jgi:hypothetical protein